VHGRPLRNQDSELTEQPLKIRGIRPHHIEINEHIDHQTSIVRRASAGKIGMKD